MRRPARLRPRSCAETASTTSTRSAPARWGPGSDPAAVVGPTGSVYGAQGLYVADASIMPAVPRANTNLPTLMVAERIAAALD